jgi:DNA repair protein RadC
MNPKDSKQPMPDHAGHRERLKARIKQHGATKLADYELLEALLFYAIPRRDTKEISKILLHKYKSINNILNAKYDDLKAIPLISDHSIVLFRLIQAFAVRLGEEKIIKKTTFGSWKDVIEYCRTRIGFEEREYFLAIFVDSRNSIIAADELAAGTVDRVAVYPREVVRHILGYNASAVILVHNHPSGGIDPSKQDIAMTKTIQQALQAIDARLHDHLIISGEGHFSFKNAGLI